MDSPSQKQGTRTPGDIDGLWTLALDLPVAHATYEDSDTERWLSFGVSPSHILVNPTLGYALSNHWLLTGTLAFEHQTGESEARRASNLRGSASPALSYLFAGEGIRPYLGAQATVSGRAGAPIEEFSAGGGPHAGLRIELTDHFAVEPRVTAQYLWRRTQVDSTAALASADATREYLNAQASLRASGWF